MPGPESSVNVGKHCLLLFIQVPGTMPCTQRLLEDNCFLRLSIRRKNTFKGVKHYKVKVKSLSCVQLLATPWTAAYQASLSMGFSRKEYWSGVPLPSPKHYKSQLQKYTSKYKPLSAFVMLLPFIKCPLCARLCNALITLPLLILKATHFTNEKTEVYLSHGLEIRGLSFKSTFSSVQLLSRVRLFVTHGLQYATPPRPSPTPRVYSNSYPLSW